MRRENQLNIFKILFNQPTARLHKIIRWILFLLLTAVTIFLFVVFSVHIHYGPSLPAFNSLGDYQPMLGAKIYSADNQLIGEFSNERRVLVPYDQIPPLLFRAFISAEDKRFFRHGGIDSFGVFKAVLDKLLHPKQKLRGASTISQQVAKSLLATHESYESATARKFRRKIREALLALRLERALSKEEILYLYVNQIFLGHKAYGVQAAAEHYFQKNVWDLNLAEMATLAGLPQRPSDYSPFSRPKAALVRRRYVLRRMLEDKHIDKTQYQTALNTEITVYPRVEMYLEVAPYYTEQVRRELIDKYGERAILEDGLEVYTSINIELQAQARDAINRGLFALDERQGYRIPLLRLASNKKDRETFLFRYRQLLMLEDDEEVDFFGQSYFLAIVEDFISADLIALNIAGREGHLPLAGMRWARKPNPVQKYDRHYIEDVRKVFKKGDVIMVKPTTRQKLSRDTHGFEVVDKMPKDLETTWFRLVQEPAAQAALLSVDPRSGYVVAQVGGYDFSISTYNRAVQACREPGSVFKPIVYSAAIDKLDYTASTLIDDKPIIFDDPDNEVRWKPSNAGQKFRGKLPLRTCLKDSINTPAIRVAEAVGINDIIKNARRLGITTPLKRELGTAIGSSCTTLFDLMKVFTTLNQFGEQRELKFIRRVVDRFGNILEDNTIGWDASLDLSHRIDRVYARLVEEKKRVLDQQTAFLTISLLKNVVREGTGIAASHMGHVVAGKTGTTNDAFDAWFMGFTRNLVSGVWVGHDKKERPLGISEQGGRTALPIWVDYMFYALRDYSRDPVRKKIQGDFDPPSGIVRVSINPETGLLARPGSPQAAEEYYRTGTEPTEISPDQSVYNPDQMNPFEIDVPL